MAQPSTEPHDYQYYNSGITEVPWESEWTVTSGISYLVFDHAKNNAFYSRTGAFIDANADFHLSQLHLPVVFGAGVTAQGFWDNDNVAGVVSVYSNVNLISVEGRISLPIVFDEPDSGPFITPRIGLGGLFDNYVVQTAFTGNHYHNGGGFKVTPAIEFGYRYKQLAIGVEVSYMLAWEASATSERPRRRFAGDFFCRIGSETGTSGCMAESGHAGRALISLVRIYSKGAPMVGYCRVCRSQPANLSFGSSCTRGV